MRASKGFTLPAVARRHPGWFAASVGAHLLFVVLLLKAYSGFRAAQAERRAATVVALLTQPLPEPVAAPPPARSRALVAPSSVPSLAAPDRSVPTDTFIPMGDTAGVTGGRRGGLAGLAPRLADRRLYAARPMYIPEGGGRAIHMDSVVRSRLLAMAALADSGLMRDSMGYLRSQYATPDWVTERNGKKYGIDQHGIHFGTFTIPTAVLALLPFPQGNIDQARANARIADMRGEILRAAARSEAEEDFRRAVSQIRERRQRERDEYLRDRERRRADDRPIN